MSEKSNLEWCRENWNKITQEGRELLSFMNVKPTVDGGGIKKQEKDAEEEDASL